MTPTSVESKPFRLKIGTKQCTITSDDEYLRRNRPGLKNRLKSGLKAAFGADVFEPRMTRLYSSLIRPRDIVLDVGANIGCTTLLFSELGSVVHGFEPLGKTFSLLKRNIEENGRSNVVLHHCALGDENKTSEIYFSDTNRSMAFVLDRTTRDDSQTAPIRVRRLDDMLPELSVPEINFVKIDVEGYEMRVINGARETFAKYKPLVEMEFNAWCLDVQQRITLPDFLDLIVSVFPIALVVERNKYISVGTTRGRYEAMAQNLLHHKYKELVCAYSQSQLEQFFAMHTDATPI